MYYVSLYTSSNIVNIRRLYIFWNILTIIFRLFHIDISYRFRNWKPIVNNNSFLESSIVVDSFRIDDDFTHSLIGGTSLKCCVVVWLLRLTETTILLSNTLKYLHKCWMKNHLQLYFVLYFAPLKIREFIDCSNSQLQIF